MNRSEALAFLGLQDDATNESIRQRLAECQSQFEKIVEESKSDFLRRVNTSKLQEISQIRRSFMEWSSGETLLKPSEMIESDSSLILAEEDEIIPIDQTIILSYSSNPVPVEYKVSPPGWLLIHTEDKPMTVFALAYGENYIGRKAHPSLSPFIVIEEDNYLSRVHAGVSIEYDQDIYSFFLRDAEMIKEERPSKNGTYLNGVNTRIREKLILKDGDTVQVGMTKLVIRMNGVDKSIEKIMEEVLISDHVATIKLE